MYGDWGQKKEDEMNKKFNPRSLRLRLLFLLLLHPSLRRCTILNGSRCFNPVRAATTSHRRSYRMAFPSPMRDYVTPPSAPRFEPPLWYFTAVPRLRTHLLPDSNKRWEEIQINSHRKNNTTSKKWKIKLQNCLIDLNEKDLYVCATYSYAVHFFYFFIYN